MELTIESIRPGDEERRHALMRQAFNATSPFDPEAPELAPERVVCAYDGDDLVGSVITLDFHQTWGGRQVRCGGVSGVAVAPQARGRGAARHMLVESFQRMSARGEVVSALYPTTASLYRSVGYEVVAWFERRRFAVGEVVAPATTLDWRATTPADPVVRELHDRMAADLDGWFRIDPDWWAHGARRAESEGGVNRFTYVGRRDGTDVAAVRYRYDRSETAMYDIDVEVVAGVDHEAVGAALALVAGHGTTVGQIRTALPAPLLAPHLPQLQRAARAEDWPLMLRLVDAPAAIEARRYPRSVEGRVALDVVDDVLLANGGPHVLEVAGGEGRLVRGGAGDVAVTAQDLAVLYAGGDVRALRAAGRLTGATDADLELLAAAFVSSPSIPLFF
ncbi:MAG: enhanced intracellular survival protein Eis [Acidimicrobiia bacterium]